MAGSSSSRVKIAYSTNRLVCFKYLLEAACLTAWACGVRSSELAVWLGSSRVFEMTSRPREVKVVEIPPRGHSTANAKNQPLLILFASTRPELFKSLDVASFICDTGEMALQLATGNDYRALFLDHLELRDRISGMSVVRSLRKMGIQTPAFLMSDTPTAVTAEFALKRGASGLIRPQAAEILNIIKNLGVSTIADANTQRQRRLVDLLAEYTGPAAPDQAAMVLARHPGTLGIEEFAFKLSTFISDLGERQHFMNLARKEAMK